MCVKCVKSYINIKTDLLGQIDAFHPRFEGRSVLQLAFGISAPADPVELARHRPHVDSKGAAEPRNPAGQVF